MAGRPNTNVPPFTRRASAGTILDLPETLQLEIFAWIPPADFTAFIASRAQFGMLYHTHWRSIYHNMLRDRYNVLADLYPFQGFNPVSAGVAPQHGVDIGYHDQLENHYIQQDHPDRFPWRSPTLTPRLPAISAEQTNLHAYVTYLDFRHQHMDCFVHDIFYKQLGLTDVSYSSLYLNMARLWRYKSPHYPGYEQVAFLKKFALAERKDLAQFLSSLAYALLRDWSDEEIMFRYGHFLTPLTTNSYPLQAQMVPALSVSEIVRLPIVPWLMQQSILAVSPTQTFRFFRQKESQVPDPDFCEVGFRPLMGRYTARMNSHSSETDLLYELQWLAREKSTIIISDSLMWPPLRSNIVWIFPKFSK